MIAARVPLALGAWTVAAVVCVGCLVGLVPLVIVSPLMALSDRFADWYCWAGDWWIHHTAERAIEWADRVTFGGSR